MVVDRWWCFKAKRSTCPLLGMMRAEGRLSLSKNGIAFSGTHEISSLNSKLRVGFVNSIPIEE